MRAGSISRRAVTMVVTALALALLGMAPLAEPGAAVRAGPAARPASAPAATHHVVALGDSVPSGAACGCRPFPTLYGAQLSARTGAPVTVDNRGVDGLTTAGLLAELDQPSIASSVRAADVVLVTIGANDFEDQHDAVVGGQCGLDTSSDCVSDALGSMRTRLGTALAQIRQLRRGQPTTVLVTGYWNVFQDGSVAERASGMTGLQASIQLSRTVNSVVRSVSTAAGARYVDLFGPFQAHGHAITSLLAADGDHPDSAGHQLIATTLLAAGLPRAAWS